VALSADDEAKVIARERLNVLAIGFYVRGGIMVVFSCFFLIYVVFLMSFSFIPESAWNQAPKIKPPPHAVGLATPTPSARPQTPGPPPVIIFRIMAAVMSGFVLVGWTIGALTLYAGRCIQKRKRKILIYVMAALNCLFIPYGILLGIFTFIIVGSPAALEEFKHTT